MRTIQIKREDLYHAVWERPIYEVAKDLGLSDVGLGKVCRRDPRGIIFNLQPHIFHR